jgi:hypothetical protein
MSKHHEKLLALKREHSAVQNMKFINFFRFLWVIFAFLEPDPDSESGSRSTDLIESGSNPDPGIASASKTLHESAGHNVIQKSLGTFLKHNIPLMRKSGRFGKWALIF